MLPFSDLPLKIDLRALRAEKLPVPKIAVLDSGIDATHPELAAHVAAAWKVERDGEEAWRVLENAPMANNDNFGHGSAVTSVILRVAPLAQVTDYCVLGKNSLGAAGMTLAALEHAIESGHKLINMSLAVSRKYRVQLLELLEYGFTRGSLVIAAQRNTPLRDLGLPAELSYSAGVNRIEDMNFCEVAFNRQSAIEFSALGNDLPVAAAGGGHTTATGTSYATPVVTGLCALFLSKWPDLEVFELKTLLKNAQFSDALPCEK